VLLLGASGAGKSTLLAALAGLLAEDSGEQEGEVVVHRTVGLVFQDPQTQLVMGRAGDDVAFGLENLGVPRAEIWPRVRAALDAVGFPYGPDRRTDQLSGGEQQRLAIAGTVAMAPGLLLLDEPTANLDPIGAALVRGVLQGLSETMILVEHRVAEALPLIDRVIALGPDGGLLADGTPEKVFAMHAAELAEAGVWVPDVHHVPRKGARAGTVLLEAPVIEVRAGEALAVTGPNGAGKTTLALQLGGLTKGPVWATAALDTDPSPYRWRARKLAGRIGSVFQNPEHQFVTSSVGGELALGGTPQSTVDALLARLRLDHLARANPYTLSGGEQRRLSVATALAAAPSVVVLDEPTFGQDLRTWRELVDLIADLRDEGRAMVFATHDADLVATLADREVRL
jgi:energy-coupling factor transport system ATP-binding protein